MERQHHPSPDPLPMRGEGDLLSCIVRAINRSLLRSSSRSEDYGISLTPRFSGVCALSWRRTVSTVSQIARKLLKQFEPPRPFPTPLKRGVNERRARYSAENSERCGLRVSSAMRFGARGEVWSTRSL